MTAAKRRPAIPPSERPKKRAVVPDVPTPPPDAPVQDEAANASAPPAATNDGTRLLGPDGGPLTPESPAGDDRGDSDFRAETGHVDPEDRATKQAPARSRSQFQGRVWPD